MARSLSDLRLLVYGTPDEELATLEAAVEAGISLADVFTAATLETDLEISAEDSQAVSASAAKAYVDDKINALPSLEDGELISWDTSVEGVQTPVLSSTVPKTAVHNSDYTFAALVNTTDTTELLKTPFVTPANSLKVSSVIDWLISGTITNNTGTDQDVTFEIIFNETSAISVTITVPTNATNRVYRILVTQLIYELIGNGVLSSLQIDVNDPAGGNNIINITKNDNKVIDLSQEYSWNIAVTLESASSSLSMTIVPVKITTTTPE